MNKKVKTTELMKKIIDVTMEIKDNHPEVYINLGESPLVSSPCEKDIDLKDFEDYLSTIQAQLKIMSTF